MARLMKKNAKPNSEIATESSKMKRVSRVRTLIDQGIMIPTMPINIKNNAMIKLIKE